MAMKAVPLTTIELPEEAAELGVEVLAPDAPAPDAAAPDAAAAWP
jgi:hypothetical protein